MDPTAYRRVTHRVGLVQEPRGVLLRVVDAVQLQDERTSRAYPRAPREKVSADYRLENGGLAAGLPADDDDLGQALPQGREVLAARRVDAVAGERARLLVGFRGWWGGAGASASASGRFGLPRVPSRGGLRERATRLKPVDEPEEGLERARGEMRGGIHSGTGRTRPRARGGVRAKGEATGLVEGRKINSPINRQLVVAFQGVVAFQTPSATSTRAADRGDGRRSRERAR